jgi:hypothetical protein
MDLTGLKRYEHFESFLADPEIDLIHVARPGLPRTRPARPWHHFSSLDLIHDVTA